MEPSDALSSPTSSLTFQPDDFEILDLALNVIPDLRIAAYVAKLAREKQQKYPIIAHDELTDLLPDRRLDTGDHFISHHTIKLFFPEDHFPIAHEYDFIVKVYAALLRARMESSQAANIRSEVTAHVERTKDAI